MSYKYKQRIEWSTYCQIEVQYQYALYDKLYDDMYNEYEKLFTKNKYTKTYTTNKLIEAKIFEEHIAHLGGFLDGLRFVKYMFDYILSSSKNELSIFSRDAIMNSNYILNINKEWHKEEFYQELKSERLLKINEHIIMKKKEAIERANKRFQENLDNDNKKEDKTIILNLTQEDINNAKNKGK